MACFTSRSKFTPTGRSATGLLCVWTAQSRPTARSATSLARRRPRHLANYSTCPLRLRWSPRSRRRPSRSCLAFRRTRRACSPVLARRHLRDARVRASLPRRSSTRRWCSALARHALIASRSICSSPRSPLLTRSRRRRRRWRSSRRAGRAPGVCCCTRTACRSWALAITRKIAASRRSAAACSVPQWCKRPKTDWTTLRSRPSRASSSCPIPQLTPAFHPSSALLAPRSGPSFSTYSYSRSGSTSHRPIWFIYQ